MKIHLIANGRFTSSRTSDNTSRQDLFTTRLLTPSLVDWPPSLADTHHMVVGYPLESLQRTESRSGREQPRDLKQRPNVIEVNKNSYLKIWRRRPTLTQQKASRMLHSVKFTLWTRLIALQAWLPWPHVRSSTGKPVVWTCSLWSERFNERAEDRYR